MLLVPMSRMIESLDFATMAQTSIVQPLLAQTGAAKTAIGWLIVLLCIGLGLLVVLRPSGRKSSK